MIGIDTLREIYIDKLQRSGSFDQAFTKACWIAFKRGREIGQIEGRGEVYSAWVQHKTEKEDE